MKYRTTPKREGCAPYVEHSTEAGAWCGPLISSEEHPRAGEIPSAVICIACGEFCEDAGASTVKTVRRLEAKYKRACEAQERARAALAKAKAWGIASEQAAKMLRKPAKAREPRAEQCSLFDRGK
jgi:hypothetical protein